MATLKDIILLKRANKESIITENLLPEDVLTGEVILCYEDGKERLYCKNTDGVIVPLHRIWNGEEIIVEEPKPTMEAVDLGLPSGKKWAKCNLGANSEEEYGLYYQWGVLSTVLDRIVPSIVPSAILGLVLTTTAFVATGSL